MSNPCYGATPEEWEAFASLNLRDLLPTVCDPNVLPSPHGTSLKEGQVDKVPSFVGPNGALGFKAWPTRVTTSVDDWANDNRLGICMIMRNVHAFDVDIENIELSRKLEGTIREFFGVDGMLMPKRSRQGSGKFAMLFRLSDGPDTLKTLEISMPGGFGKIELLFHKQQLRVAGRHKSGARLEWPEGIPKKISDIPAIKISELRKLLHMLRDDFGGVATHELGDDGSQSEIGRRALGQIDSNDPIVNYLHEHDLVREIATDGKIHIWCPWKTRHGPADNVTTTTFFPVGLGGRTDPGFDCKHAGCTQENWLTFLTEIGYEDDQFSLVEMTEAQVTRPYFDRDGKGKVKPSLGNVIALLKWPQGLGWHVRYDDFKDKISVAPYGTENWKDVGDTFITRLRDSVMPHGFIGNPTKDIMSDAMDFVAEEFGYDSLQDTLNALRWDGKPRVDSFHTRVLGLPDTPYNKAVFRYMWTALAGRAMKPGIKADMVPVLIGKQGLRKSSLVEALAPSMDEYASVTLDVRDADLARQLRGKVVAEWDEMRGLNTRDADAIKGWITHRMDDWVPKFKEFSKTKPRRFVIIGTANEKRILSDPTGARRFLPVRVTKTIDIDYVVEHRDQLWAEALYQFKKDGIAWRDAENLAANAHKLASARDMWTDSIEQWLIDQGTRQGFSSTEILTTVCSLPVSRCGRFEHQRLSRVMACLGWAEDDDGKWYCNPI